MQWLCVSLIDTGFTSPQHNLGYMAPIQENSCRTHILHRQENAGRWQTEEKQIMRYRSRNSTPAGKSELKTVNIPFKSHLVASYKYDMQGTDSGLILYVTA